MRDIEEQRLALECLKLAGGCIRHAEGMLAFVTGRDADDAKAKLEAVREALT